MDAVDCTRSKTTSGNTSSGVPRMLKQRIWRWLVSGLFDHTAFMWRSWSSWQVTWLTTPVSIPFASRERYQLMRWSAFGVRWSRGWCEKM